MLKGIATTGAALIFVLVLAGGFLGLQTWCSSEDHLPKLETPLQPNGSKENSEHSGASQQPASPEGEQTKPSAAFDLRVTDQNKIEGRYYAEKTEKEDWGHKFFCEIKIGEVLLAIFTLFLVFYTARLYWATTKLAEADRPHIFPVGFKVIGMKTDQQPVQIEFNFKNFGRSPAYLQNFIIGCRQEGILPPEPDYRNAGTIDVFAALPPETILHPTGATGTIEISAVTKIKVLSGEVTLFIFGCINFEETSGAKHFQRFAFRYIPETDGLANTGPSTYWHHS
jgi:hypothetical protein